MTIATLAPIIGFISSLTTVPIMNFLRIGNVEQTFRLCDSQRFCEKEGRELKRYLSKNIGEVVKLNIHYETSLIDWDRCTEGLSSEEGDEAEWLEAENEEINSVFEIPLWDKDICTGHSVANFDSSVPIRNHSFATDTATFRIIGSFLVGGHGPEFFLTKMDL